MSTQMPRTIKICGRRIRLSSEFSMLNLTSRGVHNDSLNAITLDASCAPDEQRAVALHEVMHDLDLCCGTGLTEQSVASLSSVLFGVIRDNPKFVAWLQGKG